MKKILNHLTFGHFVLVHERPEHQNFTVCGFSVMPLEDDANILTASNGEQFSKAHTRFGCGKNAKLLLCNEDEHSHGVLLRMREVFPDQDVILATEDGKLTCFAPICQSESELVDFLLGLDDFFISNSSNLRGLAYDEFFELATWLYRNHANR